MCGSRMSVCVSVHMCECVCMCMSKAYSVCMCVFLFIFVTSSSLSICNTPSYKAAANVKGNVLIIWESLENDHYRSGLF